MVSPEKNLILRIYLALIYIWKMRFILMDWHQSHLINEDNLLHPVWDFSAQSNLLATTPFWTLCYYMIEGLIFYIRIVFLVIGVIFTASAHELFSPMASPYDAVQIRPYLSNEVKAGHGLALLGDRIRSFIID